MILKKIIYQLNIPAQCRRYGLSLWQCPQFLFLVMGIFIIVASLSSYLIGSRFIADPEVVALTVLFIAAVLFIIASVITKNFEKLAEISRMKSEFINIVTHQMRAPLTNLKWTVDFLTLKEDRRDIEKEEEYYSSLRENIGRMVELIDDLLLISKLEEEIPIRRKEISLKTLISDLIWQFKFFAEASNIKIEFYPQEKLPMAYIDPSQIKIAIENLIDNALRYTRGGGAIEIWLKKRNKDLLLKIKDSGVGIPERDQRYIFQKFFRSENALREQTRGSGLGLYIAKKIIENSGGRIWFDSKEGKGTTFYITLPTK